MNSKFRYITIVVFFFYISNMYAQTIKEYKGTGGSYVDNGVSRTFEKDRYTDANKMLSSWDFDVELGNYLGFNIDQQAPGLLGIAKLTMESNIYQKSDVMLQEKGQFSGKINIKDLEIKSYLDSATLSSDNTQAFPLNISWGNIEGFAYIGPFYFQLAYNNHDRVDTVDTLDDEDLDFSVINYSIIPLQDTATFEGATTFSVGDVIRFNIDDIRGLVAGEFIENTYGAFALGFLYSDWLDIRLGASTKVGYLDKVATNYNPYALSLAAKIYLEDYKQYSFFTLNIKSSVSSGINNNTFFEEDNPAFFATSAQYRIPLFNGVFGLSPLVGFEAQLEYQQILQPGAIFAGNRPSASRNKWILSQIYEAVGGVIFDWNQLGVSKDEGNHLLFRSSANDVVTDGISATLGFGYMTNEIFRELKIPYLGLKVALWDSEDDTKKGLIPFLETAFIMNINYTLGSTYDGFHNYIDAYLTEDSSTVTIGERVDFGVGWQAKTSVSFVRPYFNVFLKHLDIFDGEDTYEISPQFNLSGARYYDNKADLRTKIGFEAVGILHRITLEGYWESGDLIKGDKDNIEGELTNEDFFATENASGNRIFISNARYGFIAIGAKVKF